MVINKTLPSGPTQSSSDLEELKEENELLLLQLCQAQEELELWFTRFRELEAKNGAQQGVNDSTKSIKNLECAPQEKACCKTSGVGSVDTACVKEVSNLVAENIRLTALLQVQKLTGDIIAQNALSSRLGNLIIQGVSHGGSLVAALGKLFRIWRGSSRPPAYLGGESFTTVIKEYESGGFEAVLSLLSSVEVPEIRAKAYTALGRHLMQVGCADKAAEAAQCAYEDDPKPYRLKWLAFKLQEAGKAAEAEACLSLLPQGISFSNSELRQRDRVYFEAEINRSKQAQEHASVLVCLELAEERDAQAALVRAGAEQIADLQRQLQERELAGQTVAEERDAQAALVQVGKQQIEALRQQVQDNESSIQAMCQAKALSENECARLEQKMQESRQAAMLSMKLQMLREADLKDLQARYQDLRLREEEQNKLLLQLAERLSAASEYFHQLINCDKQRQFQGTAKNNSAHPIVRKRMVRGKGRS